MRRGLFVPYSTGTGHQHDMTVGSGVSLSSTQRGTKSELDASPLPSRGPKEGGNATSLLHSRGSPNKGGQNQKWLPHPTTQK